MSGRTALAVPDWRVANPECNAPLTTIRVHAMRFAGAQEEAHHSVQMVKTVAAIDAQSSERRQQRQQALERFRRATLRRVQERLAQERSAKRDQDAVLQANLEQYMAATRQQMRRLASQRAAQLQQANRSALDRERDKIRANAMAARSALLSFSKTGQAATAAPDRSPPPVPAKHATGRDATAFWARPASAGGRQVAPSKGQLANLGATVRKWEMVQERTRVRAEAIMTLRSRAQQRRPQQQQQLNGYPTTTTTSVKGSVVETMADTMEGDAILSDAGIERLSMENNVGHVEDRHERVRRYAEEVRAKNRLSASASGRGASKEHARRALLERMRATGVPIPALCACGLTVFSDPASTGHCANNCSFFRNPAAFDRAVDSVLQSIVQ
ncbi:unnamed protein product (mitochondrion) [Plasmodiophora brassicae]|uniref:Uncharacterized protein n=1 Tax=Plasmodiophora brassicae TaxID=37360 RepID=A0A3P3YJW4_PLABS|nr:unnamed protein product [Plasmodiophora brassicae]